jgi:hypothetical protein
LNSTKNGNAAFSSKLKQAKSEKTRQKTNLKFAGLKFQCPLADLPFLQNS